MMSGAIHMYMDYRPCRTDVGLDRLYFYEGSRESAEYQALFRATMARINPIERLVFDFKNHHPRPLALGRRNLWRQIGSTVIIATLPASLALNAMLPAAADARLVRRRGDRLPRRRHLRAIFPRHAAPRGQPVVRPPAPPARPADDAASARTSPRDAGARFRTNCGWSNPLLNRVFAFMQRTGRLDRSGLEPH